MSEENQETEPEETPLSETATFRFQDDESAGVRVLIMAFIDTYNSYRRMTKDIGLEEVLADLNLRAQALKEISECDDTFVALVKDKIRAVDQSTADLGRVLLLAIQYMNHKRGVAMSKDRIAEEWPDVVDAGESEN